MPPSIPKENLSTFLRNVCGFSFYAGKGVEFSLLPSAYVTNTALNH